MPKASKQSASHTESMEGFEGHYENFDGGYTVGFESYGADADMALVFQGLPDDACQSEHWGYLFKGSFRVGLTDGSEMTVSAGEAYYLPPGHRVQAVEDVELVEFSPLEEFGRTMAQVEKNTASMKDEVNAS